MLDKSVQNSDNITWISSKVFCSKGTSTNTILLLTINRTYRSGEITLKTQQFLEELRKNPTLKIMRDELVQLLQDQLEKIGVPPVSYLVFICLSKF